MHMERCRLRGSVGVAGRITAGRISRVGRPLGSILGFNTWKTCRRMVCKNEKKHWLSFWAMLFGFCSI